MSRFMVGDTVEAVITGSGIGTDKLYKKTTITAINGRYSHSGNGRDGVKTKDFKNTPYNDWIGEVSFKLVKAIQKLEPDDRVAVIDCEEIRNWPTWERAIGQIYTLTKEQVEKLNDRQETNLGENKYRINFLRQMLEKI